MGTKNFDEFVREELQDSELAAEYLTASLEDGSLDEFLIALRNVADAHGGMSVISEITQLNRQNLYKMLSEEGNPTLESLITILNALGINLSFTVKDKLVA